MAYSEECLKSKLDKHLKDAPSELYKAAFVQYIGKTTDTIRDISDFLASQIDLNKIEVTKTVRRTPYRQKDHQGLLAKGAPLKAKNEKRFARALYNREERKLGAFTLLDYQVPLKAEMHDDSRGEIDLLAIDESGNLCLIELKPPKKKKDETLLRAVLEIHTYFLTIKNNEYNFKKEYEASDAKLRKIVLVGEGSLAGETAINLNNHKSLAALCDKVGVEIFVYDAKNLDSLEFTTTDADRLKPKWNADIAIRQVFPAA